MSDVLCSRFALQTGDNQLLLDPIDPENYAVIINGDYEAAFSGYKSAHACAIRRAKESNEFSPDQIVDVSDLSKWDVETIDVFDPEEN